LVVTGKPTNGTTCIYNNTGGTLTLLGSKHLIFVTGGTTKWYNRIYKQTGTLTLRVQTSDTRQPLIIGHMI
jgi:hypothetical protein